MSISQLDDPSMREALGIETDVPTSLANPTQIGSGAGSITISCGALGANNGQLFLNGLDGAGSATAGLLFINDAPVDNSLRNLWMTPSAINFQQSPSGTTTTFASYNNGNGAVAVSGVASLAGVAGGAAVTNVASLAGVAGGAALTNIATINGKNVYTGSYAVSAALAATIAVYPTVLFLAVIPHSIPAGRSALLTVLINGLVTPNTVGVGTDTLGIGVRQQTGNVPTPSTLFSCAPTQLDTDLAGSQQPIVLTAQTIIVSDGGANWTVAVNVLASTTGTTYAIGGGAVGIATLTELA